MITNELFSQVTADQVSKMLHAIGFNVEKITKHKHFVYSDNKYKTGDGSAWDKLVELELATVDPLLHANQKTYHVSEKGMSLISNLLNIAIFDQETYKAPQEANVEEEGEKVDIEEMIITGLQAKIHPRLIISSVKVSEDLDRNGFISLDLKGIFFEWECIITINTEKLHEGKVLILSVSMEEDILIMDALYDLIAYDEEVNNELAQLCRESVVKLGFNEDGSQKD